jgi:hypothetical protein
LFHEPISEFYSNLPRASNDSYVSLTISYLTAKNAAVLSLACRAETNTIVAGTELASSQAAVVFW